MTIVDTPVLAADLTFVKVNGGRAFADLVNWDEDADPYEGQRVLLADAGSQRLEALITAIRGDGTLALPCPSPPTRSRCASRAESSPRVRTRPPAG